jgi:outer membrane protein assembly factor BamB
MLRYLMRVLLIPLLCLVLILTVTIARTAISSHAAGASITLSMTSGPPTSNVNMNGSGFKSGEMITLMFDTTQIGQTIANRKGAFSSKITIPGTALPGNHAVQATGKSSHLSALSTFLVQTNWTMFGFAQNHSHFNPYENVLSLANVSGLTLDWIAALGNIIWSSPAVVNGKVFVGCVDGKLYALNASTGRVLWTATTGNTIYCYLSHTQTCARHA